MSSVLVFFSKLPKAANRNTQLTTNTATQHIETQDTDELFILRDSSFASSSFPFAFSLHHRTHSLLRKKKMSVVAEWDNEYARLARAASQMRTQGLATQAGDAQSLQVGLQRLEQQLNSLSTTTTTTSMPPAEIQRRRRLIQHLRQQQQQQGGGGYQPPTVGGEQQQPQQQQQPQSRMAVAMRQQDDMIDELAVGVGRLKNQTVAIGDEARMHVNLLNDMETNLDTAVIGLDEETRRATRLRQDQSLWRLQLIVAGLFILLVLLILMGLSP